MLTAAVTIMTVTICSIFTNVIKGILFITILDIV
jgi:hypothetical protein